MSKNNINLDNGDLKSVKIDVHRHQRERRNTTHNTGFENSLGVKGPKVSSRSNDFVYVNTAYVGSVNSINEVRQQPVAPPTNTVIREQYWACSRWPFAQRMLAIAVGVLLGTVVGLALTVAISRKGDDAISGFFRSSAPD